MKIIYMNSKKEEIEFEKNTRLKKANLHNYSWGYEATDQEFGKSVDKFTKNVSEYELTIEVSGELDFRKKKIESIYDIMQYDVVMNECGKICFGEWYLNCFAMSSKTYPNEKNSRTLQEIKLVAPYPFWIREQKITYERKQASDTGYLDYPYDYPYDYSPNDMAVYLENTEVMSADFKLVIQGPCENPQVTIGQNKCQIMTTLSSYEYIVLNSMDRTAYKVSSTGTVTNVFEALNRNYENFDRIPQGKHIISINGTFRMEITMYMKRSEPRWT